MPPEQDRRSPLQTAIAANKQRRQRESILASLPAAVSRVLDEAPCVYSPDLEQFIRHALPPDRDEQTEIDIDRLLDVLRDRAPATGEAMLWLGSGPASRVDSEWAQAQFPHWLDVEQDIVLVSVDGNHRIFASAAAASPEDKHPDGCSGAVWGYSAWQRTPPPTWRCSDGARHAAAAEHPSVNRMMNLHFFKFVARPSDGPMRGSEAAGAFVNCWIDRPDRSTAEEVARQIVAASSWAIESLEDYRVVSDGDYETSDRGREHYEQALIDKEVIVFHTWPASGDYEDGSNAG
ncbi:MAG: hypothetical protein R3F30_13215 [Planctomycetota bacterium]